MMMCVLVHRLMSSTVAIDSSLSFPVDRYLCGREAIDAVLSNTEILRLHLERVSRSVLKNNFTIPKWSFSIVSRTTAPLDHLWLVQNATALFCEVLGGEKRFKTQPRYFSNGTKNLDGATLSEMVINSHTKENEIETILHRWTETRTMLESYKDMNNNQFSCFFVSWIWD